MRKYKLRYRDFGTICIKVIYAETISKAAEKALQIMHQEFIFDAWLINENNQHMALHL